MNAYCNEGCKQTNIACSSLIAIDTCQYGWRVSPTVTHRQHEGNSFRRFRHDNKSSSSSSVVLKSQRLQTQIACKTLACSRCILMKLHTASMIHLRTASERMWAWAWACVAVHAYCVCFTGLKQVNYVFFTACATSLRRASECKFKETCAGPKTH